MGVSENRGPQYSTLNRRIQIIRAPKYVRKLPHHSSPDPHDNTASAASRGGGDTARPRWEGPASAVEGLRGSGPGSLGFRDYCRNLIKKPWAYNPQNSGVHTRNPNKGPRILNQVPTKGFSTVIREAQVLNPKLHNPKC